jgi:GAF domain-containing protein
VLKVVSRSTFDLQTVLNTLVESAARLCDSDRAWIVRRDGEVYRLAASYGHSKEEDDQVSRYMPADVESPGRGSVVARTVLERQPVQIVDVLADPEYTLLDLQKIANYRTALGIPLLREGIPIGVLAMTRSERRSFTDKQIELLATFADQAVIAIENTRLVSELRESLQQQTATADVLKVISRSTFDLQAVMNTLVQSAAQLCAADKGAKQDGDLLGMVANYGFSPEAEQYATENPGRVNRGSVTGRVLLEGKAIHIPDVLADPEYGAFARGYQRVFGYRTYLGVPLLRDGTTTIGSFSLTRDKVSPFTEKQIELVRTFADQAVIAIENARLLNELRHRTADLTESLEQQTATSEVLQVISSSPGDVQPVFATMLENAVRICDATFGNIYRWDDDALHLVAAHNTPSAFAEYRRRVPMQFDQMPESMRQMIETMGPIQIDPLAALDHEPKNAIARSGVELGGIRTVLNVPMLKEKELVGAFMLSRQEVRPFTDKQVALVMNFARQAAIAIENARLLEELRERTSQLEVQSQEVVKLNQQLEQRVADQVGEIERMGRLRRFLPPQVADLIVASGTEKQLESHRREITALFCDLRGFTGFSEASAPEDVIPRGHRRNHHQVQRHA